jgi:hypothetical protein
MKDRLSVVTFIMGALCFAIPDQAEARCAQCSPLTGQARALQTSGFS